MDNLLRILGVYPEMLNVIRKKEEPLKRFATVTYLSEAKTKKVYQIQGESFTADPGEVVYGG